MSPLSCRFNGILFRTEPDSLQAQRDVQGPTFDPFRATLCCATGAARTGWLLAGMLYLGSGIGLLLLTMMRGDQSATETPLRRKDVPWLAGAVIAGGIDPAADSNFLANMFRTQLATGMSA